MSDYIKREDALNALREYPVTKLKTAIRRLPSADVAQVRHGRWECGEENSWWCPVCGMGFDLLHGTPQENLYNYCPNCGARMDGEK